MSEAWDAEIARELQELETEHGYQAGLIDKLLGALETDDKLAANALFDQLLDVTSIHFADEQVLMRQHSYPIYGAHLDEHRRMVEALQDLINRNGAGEKLNDEVIAVRGWFASHIAHMDREFTTHIAVESASRAVPHDA
jgi:hemerythrin-like metal-binding protein